MRVQTASDLANEIGGLEAIEQLQAWKQLAGSDLMRAGLQNCAVRLANCCECGGVVCLG